MRRVVIAPSSLLSVVIVPQPNECASKHSLTMPPTPDDRHIRHSKSLDCTDNSEWSKQLNETKQQNELNRTGVQ